jgi:hypothetical protein
MTYDFIAAPDIDDPTQRCYLDESCRDLDLRKRVEALIHSTSRPSLTPAPESNVGHSGNRAVTEVPGDAIGPCKLLQQIGEGGMGVVFMAEQTELTQRTGR